MIEPVRVGFSTTNRFFSQIIRALTNAPVSHAFLVYRDVDFDRDMVMEAVGQGFRIVPFDKFQRHNKVVAVFEPRHSIEKGLRDAVDWLGSAYDKGGLVGMVLVLVGRWLRLWSRNPFRNSTTLFCSEAVARACLSSGYPGFTFDPESTSPRDLYEFFAAEARGGAGAPAPSA